MSCSDPFLSLPPSREGAPHERASGSAAETGGGRGAAGGGDVQQRSPPRGAPEHHHAPVLVLAPRSDLGRQPLGLLEECVHEPVVRHPADLPALREQQAAPGPRGDPDVGVARLSRAVDLAAHHGYLHRRGSPPLPPRPPPPPAPPHTP